MAQVFANNASSTLTSGINDTTGSIQIDAGDATEFPAPTGGDFYYATISSLDANGLEDTWEIVRVNGRTGNTLTVVRGQDGTAAAAWGSGSKIEARVTSGILNRFETAYQWGDHSAGGYAQAATTLAGYGITNGLSTATAFGGDVSGTYNNLQVANDSHTHDTRYYTEAEVDALLAGKQATGTYNTIIGTDTDLNTAGAQVIDVITMTDGVIQSITTRDLTPADIGAEASGGGGSYLPLSGGTLSGNLNVTGNIVATGDITAYSDMRLKTDVLLLDPYASLNMTGVSFLMNGKESSGVIAQQLEEVAPELVLTNEDGYKSVAYGNIVGYLIETVKMLNERIEALESKEQ